MTVKQYTGRANINIYHGDCMEFMKDKPAKYWDLGFDLDIIELDKDYYDKAVERFERHINQKQLF